MGVKPSVGAVFEEGRRMRRKRNSLIDIALLLVFVTLGCGATLVVGVPEAMATSSKGNSNAAGVGGLVANASGRTGNVVCDPSPVYFTAAAPAGTIAVNYLGGGDGAVVGYSIGFSWDSSIVSTTTDDVSEGNLLSDLGLTFFYAAPGSGDEIIVDCAILGSNPGALGPGTLFEIGFAGVGFGTSDIDIEILAIRDQDNTPLGGFSVDDGMLVVDVSAPAITDVSISNTTLADTDDYIKDSDEAQVTAAVLDDDPAFTSANIVADLSGLGGSPGVNPGSYNNVTGEAVWNLASVICTPADGSVGVDVTAADAIGNPALAGSDTIIADNTAPEAVTDFDAAPGHQRCDLSWTMGTDLHPAGVVVQRGENTGDYPLYATFKGAWPDVEGFYPGSELHGIEIYDGVGTSVADTVPSRNIYFYQAFCYDVVRNYGPAATTARDPATNYWLGDVAAGMGVWGYNGLVNDGDIDKLGSLYHAAPPGPPENEMDVGPTVHPIYGPLGLPTPDSFIGFEDLMVFAMNYEVVGSRVVPLLGEPAEGQLMLALEEVSTDAGGEVELALRLEGNTADVKGVRAVLELEGMELVSARLSDGASTPLARTFLWCGVDQIDVAVLGSGVSIGGSGEVARLRFQTATGDYSAGFSSASLRGVDNEELTVRLEGCESSSDTPRVFQMTQNSPNPFNPTTTVAFCVPHESRIAVRVCDVSGRVVRTLFDGIEEPGRHAVVWDGRNDRGESCSSGVYFCVMKAPGYVGNHKMLLLK